MIVLEAQRKTRNLVVAILLLVASWMVVLPWVGGLPGIREHIQSMRQKHIHPDAMFYTELE
jgi:hypothetical protein